MYSSDVSNQRTTSSECFRTVRAPVGSHRSVMLVEMLFDTFADRVGILTESAVVQTAESTVMLGAKSFLEIVVVTESQVSVSHHPLFVFLSVVGRVDAV